MHPLARLAVPAFFTLIAEPLFLLTDSAIVGHLGTDSLAALGAASAILLTTTGVFVFLAYATTATVAQYIGAGRREEAIQSGFDGVWLAIALGVPLAALIMGFARPLAVAMGGQSIASPAQDYLLVSAWGIPAMLITLALQGSFRGLQDTRTPLWVTTVGFALNAALNAVAVLILHLGLVGSALGTMLTQWLMAVVLLMVLLRQTRHVSNRPHPARVLQAARTGFPLLVRTAALRAALLITTAVAGGLGTRTLAAHQVASTIFTFLTFSLDAIAIAAQALVGEARGSGDLQRTRSLTDIIVRWGWWSGLLAGIVTAALAWALPALFTSDVSVRHDVTAVLLVIAVVQPIAGVLFVLDGVLMGAGDGVFLAWTQLGVLAFYLPLVLGVQWIAPQLHMGGATPLVVLWIAYCLNLTVRCGALEWRRRGSRWMDADAVITRASV